MSIKVMYGDEVISESNNLKSTDYIKNPKDSRPFYDRKKILEPVGKNTTGIKVSLTYGGEPFTNEIKIVNKHNKKEECKPIVKPRIVMPTDAVSAPVEKSIEKAPINVAEPEVVTTTESNIVDTSTSNTETKTYPNEFKPDESEAKEVKVTTIEEYKPIDGVTIKEEYSKPEEDHSTEDVEIANPVDDETVIKDELVYKKITMPPENEESSSIMGNEGFNSLPPEMQELLMNQD